MPSRRPRMMLTLDPEVVAALSDLADAMGKPAATVAAELLTEAVPQVKGLAKYARALKAGKKDAAKRALSHMLGDAMAEQLELLTPTGSHRG